MVDKNPPGVSAFPLYVETDVPYYGLDEFCIQCNVYSKETGDGPYKFVSYTKSKFKPFKDTAETICKDELANNTAWAHANFESIQTYDAVNPTYTVASTYTDVFTVAG